MTLVLGIETSCDETSAAVVADGCDVRSSLIASQHEVHARYGGVVPELASRAHLERLDSIVTAALQQAGVNGPQLDAIAVTSRPGLIGALLIGVTAAKTLAWAWNKPLIGVHHVHAHATSAALASTTAMPHPLRSRDGAADELRGASHSSGTAEGGCATGCATLWPAIALVVSGGHTSLFEVRDPCDIVELGRTIDDAAGEAFDKVAAILGLGFPGGPAVDARARRGNPAAIAFPRTLLSADSLDFSFSGLKTAVLYHVHGPGRTTGGLERLSPALLDDICASFSAAVVDVLVRKTLAAAKRTGLRRIVVGGGVAANSMLRERLSAACARDGIALRLTPPQYCTDNAAMIAAHAYYALQRGRVDDLSLAASAS